MKNKLYSISDLTSVLNLHPKTILRFIHEGKIKARKIGRSWMVTENDLELYCHGELTNKHLPQSSLSSDSIEDRITVSAVVEIVEQDSEDASRISNSLMAMLNSEISPNGKPHFNFFYYPEIQKAKYVFYGTPRFIGRILESFDVLCRSKGDFDE